MAADTGTGKATKLKAKYRPSDSKTVNCAGCTMSTFGKDSRYGSRDNEGTCTAVAGPIDKKDVCRFFEAKK